MILSDDYILTKKFWDHVSRSKDTKVWNWLCKDRLDAIVLDGNTFFIEGRRVPNYIHDYIVKWGKSLGLKYLYD